MSSLKNYSKEILKNRRDCSEEYPIDLIWPFSMCAKWHHHSSLSEKEIKEISKIYSKEKK